MTDPDKPQSQARTRRRLSAAWAVAVAAMALWVALRVLGGGAFNGDIMALLPGAAREPAVAAAIDIVQTRAERQLLLLVGGGEADAAVAAARGVRDRLDASGVVQAAEAGGALPATDIARLAARHRWSLLTPEVRARLAAGNWQAFERSVLRRYFSPGAALGSDLVEQDPLLLLPTYLESGAAELDPRMSLVDGIPVLRDGDAAWALVQAELTASPFDFDVQARAVAALDAAKAELAAQDPPLTLLTAGVLPHAAAGTAAAEREISRIGVLSLIGIVVLLVGIFRSVRPLLLSAMTIAVGCLAGMSATLALFGQVHLFTLVFGISLTGTAVDYAVHFFATLFRTDASPWRPAAALKHVWSGITMGLATTTLGFGGLVLSGFPGLMQIACFSIAGLAAAWATTVLWVPALAGTRAPIGTGPVTRLADRWLGLFARPGLRRAAPALIAALLILAVWGAMRAAPQDDVRDFQGRDPAVTAEQDRAQAIMGQSFATAFFLVQADDVGDLLAREEALRNLLDDGCCEGLEGHVALSRFVPSPARQAEDLALVRQAVQAGVLDRVAARVGLTEEAVANAQTALDAAEPLRLETWLAHPASAPFRHLWLGRESTGGVASVVLLRGGPDPAALQALSLPTGVQLVDPVGDISGVFARYRAQATWLILGAYAIVTAVLLARYGWSGGLRIVAVPLAAAAACVAWFGLAEGGISLFHLMALLLVLGLGVDYGLFFGESAGMARPTMIAVAVSALTTLLAFGLLAFSDTAAISAFGQTVAVGILTAFLVSPFSKRADRTAPHPMETSDVG